MSSGSSNDFMIFGLEVTTLPPPFLRNRKNHQNLPKSWSRDQQKRFWGGPQATTKPPKKIFFEKIIFEPQHIQKLSESGQGARKTVQNRQICQKFTNFSQNLQTLSKSNCRTTLVPTVVSSVSSSETGSKMVRTDGHRTPDTDTGRTDTHDFLGPPLHNKLFGQKLTNH